MTTSQYSSGNLSVYNTIQNCICYNNTLHGIYLWTFKNYKQPAYTTIKDCTLYNNGIRPPGTVPPYSGINIDALDYNIIENCTIYHNGRGIDIEESAHNIVRNCQIFNHNFTAYIAEGITITGDFMSKSAPRGNKIIHCDIYDNEAGMVLFHTLRTSIQKSNIYNNCAFGIFMPFIPFGITTALMHDNNIYHNGFEWDVARGLLAQLTILDIRHNWWGASDGPGYDGPGSGDELERWLSIILLRPWATEPIPDAGRQ